ncbi:thiosulfate/3-mercaptopyruvate sulfurtransferase [Sporomusa sp. KB1]|nr:thiosulfate/3-mercaptopyruvate sulfurtransferase [Sporomusa sp. KB1]
MKNGTVKIIDVRPPERYQKEHLPGAVWLYWGDLLNPDKTLKNAGELRKIFTAKGITPDKTVITYCQAGVRAAHTASVLSKVLGFKNVKNYAGSWIEWSQREELPMEIDGQNKSFSRIDTLQIAATNLQTALYKKSSQTQFL